MPTDKKISELPVASSLNSADVSVLVDNDTDYQYTFALLLQFLEANLSMGASISFGIVLPQNTTGNDGDVFVNTAVGTFAQKISDTWTIVYTLPAANAADGAMLYGAGLPGSSTGKNADSYINTLTGIFYQKSSGSWSQVFSMATGPQGPQGTPGTNGANGTNGNTILFGTTNPSNTSTGINGNFYINTNFYTLFGPKTAGIWGDGIPMIGTGIAAGGTAGQFLAKVDNADYNTIWEDNSFANLSGQPGDNANMATALATKQDTIGYTAENAANKSTSTSLGTSDVLYPSQNAVKVYVDSVVSGSIAGVTSFNGRTGAVVPTIGDYAALTESLTNKNLASGTNTFPTFNQNTSGNAASATVLQTGRNIQGIPFNGSADINIISGTGFVKAAGATLSYDNNTYLTTAAATSAYQPIGSYLTAITGISAGGDLTGTYPSPTITTINGITKSFYDPTSSIQTQLNGKQAAITLTTTGTSGAATLTGGTLNIPQYSSGGGSSIYSADGTLTGNRTVTLSGNTFTLSDTNPAIFFSNPSYSGSYTTSLGGWGGFGHLVLGNNGTNFIQGGTSATGGSLSFFTNCTNAFGVTPNGNLALALASSGNASFGYDLTVSGAFSVTGSTTFGNVQFGTSSGGAIITSTSAGSNAVYQKISNSGGDAYIGLSNSAGGGLLGTASAYALNIQTASARDIVFGTNNAENMRLFNSGNFVIGQHTDVSSSKFTVGGSTTQGTIPWTQMTTSQRTAISSPAESLAVYDLTLHKLYVYDGTTWQAAW